MSKSKGSQGSGQQFQHRDAINGQFITEAEAKRRPKTTVSERRKRK